MLTKFSQAKQPEEPVEVPKQTQHLSGPVLWDSLVRKCVVYIPHLAALPRS